MSTSREGLRFIGFDALGLAVGTALVAGALSLVAPFLTALTGTLGALAVASWAMVQTPRRSAGRRYLAQGWIAPLSILSAGTIVFLVPLRELDPFRALLLALSLVPLWWSERPLRSRGRTGGEHT
ncbi:MAG TPA: hypothetical protein VEK13_06080 [Thermoplasmata archaeon]|nr:hypothetical protein [Thermoplasmata archaeon]